MNPTKTDFSTKQEIRAWLRTHARNRQWLADACSVKLTTVNDWFTQRGIIPGAKLSLIRQLMEADATPEAVVPSIPADGVTAVAVMMKKSERALIMEAARLTGTSIEQFILTAGMEKAQGILKVGGEQTS